MAYATNKTPVYAKGTMDVWLFNPATFDLDFYSNKVQTNSLSTSTNMGEINGSLRNPVLLNLPDSAKVELQITAATSSLESRALSVGGELSYNGIIPVLENVVPANDKLTVSQTPVAPYGTDKVYCFVDKSGVAYEVDPETKAVVGFTPEETKNYCVRYFVKAASAHQLRIASTFEPNIEICMIRIPLYTTQGNSSTQGTRWGDRYIWIPRMQFTGNAPVKGDQTDADSEDLSGTALPYEEAAAEGICIDEASFALAYMVDMPAAGALASVRGLAVVGGAMSLKNGATAYVPVKYVMEDGMLTQPAYEDLTFTTTDSGHFTVGEHTGLVTATGVGAGEITVQLTEDENINTVLNVTVTAAT